MELYTAIKNILKYQGDAFLHDAKMLNALDDFQAYDSHPALKNIFRTLHNDGYIDKLTNNKSWDSKCTQLIYEIVRNYAFPHDIVEYVLKSVAYGLGIIRVVDVSIVKTNSQHKPAKNPDLNRNVAKSKQWKQLSVDEKECFLNSLVVIKPSDCGLIYDSVYIADSSYNSSNNVNFKINFELSGKLLKQQSINLACAIYDTSNRLRVKEVLTSTLNGRKGKSFNIIESHWIGINFQYQDIGKILMFMDVDD